MGGEVNPLERLGDTIAKTQDEALPAIVQGARERLAAPNPARSRTSARRPSKLVVSVAAALALSAAFAIASSGVWRSRAADPLTFEVGSAPGVVHAWVEAPSAHEMPVRFSDGTTVLLGAESRGSVAAVGREGAHVTVDRGRAVVSIAPRAGAKWMFDVGPFAVVAVGSRFDASWEPGHEIFDLAIQDGSVRVSGPKIDGERTYVAGQHLRIALSISGDSLAPPEEAPTAASAPSGSVAVPSLGVAPIATHATPAHSSSWRELSGDGRYADALSAVVPQFDALCTRSPAAEVIMLGDTARLAGDAARAKQAYAATRARFPGSADAALAAFSLARLAAQEGAQPDAARWFETYLREASQGPLAREALGRAMEARDKQGDHDTARAHAARYLATYPEGPHARLARKITGE